MAMELACSRLCSVSTWGTSNLRIRAPLDSRPQNVKLLRISPRVKAAQEVDTEESNEEDSTALPSEEVGKLRLKWEAEEPSKPMIPREKKWTGYVEKDTAGQTNIYAVEPAVYVADSLLSSGEAGTSTEGTGNSAAVAAGLALVAVASVSSVLLFVMKNAPVTPEVAVGYSGPPLSYYIAKFTPAPVVVEEIVIVEEFLAPELTSPEESIPLEDSA